MNISRRGSLLVLGGSFLGLKAALAQASAPPSQFNQASFSAAMERIEQESGGRLGVALITTGSSSHIYTYRPLEKFPMCSTFKLLLSGFILQVSDEGRVSLDQEIEIKSTDIVANSPITNQNIGKSLKIRQLCEATMTRSDNAAANLLLNVLGGHSEFARRLRMLWDHQTRLDRFEPALNSAIPSDPRDTTTPSSMALDLRQFLMPRANRTVLLPQSQEILKTWLINNQTGGESLKKHMPQNWIIGDKTGAGENNTINDVAVIYLPNGDVLYLAAYLTGAREEFPNNKKHLADIGSFIAANF